MADDPLPRIEDTFNATPLDVADCIWQLLPHTDRLSLRQASTQVLQLTDQLITTATHDLSPYKLQRTDHHHSNRGDDDSDDDDSETCRQRLDGHIAASVAWEAAASKRFAFLERLPRLNTLTLQSGADEAALVTTLRRYHPAVPGRLTSLCLLVENETQLTQTAMATIAAACPHLGSLTLRDTRYYLDNLPRSLRGALFEPFWGHPLAKLKVKVRQLSGNVLRSLAGLSHLRSLDITASKAALHPLPLLTRLSSLSHLSMKLECRHLRDYSALLQLTQLTSFHITNASPTPPEWVPPTPLVGGMTHLLSLRLSVNASEVDDALFTGLKQLTQLTQLSLHSMCLSHPQGGHLPRLQELTVASKPSPDELLRTLQPLLPLPSLTALAADGIFQRPKDRRAGRMLNCGSVWDEGDANAVCPARAAALAQIAAHLAAAPRLHLSALQLNLGQRYGSSAYLSSDDDEEDDGGIGNQHHSSTRNPRAVVLHLTLRQLQPLARQLRHLTLDNCGDVGARWSVLAPLLPGLTHLVLWRCHVSPTSLARVVLHMTALQSLCAFHCPGKRPETIWQRLRLACVRPVQLHVFPQDPAAPSDLLAECGAV